MYSVVFVLDKSGSMNSLGNEPVDSLNNFYIQQRAKNCNFNSTLIFFNDNVEFIHKNIPGTMLEHISYDKYKPNSMTALYDAIGAGIEYQKTVQNENVIFVILTDGLENCSQKYNKEQIKALIKDLEENNEWKFIYLGANQDAFEIGNSIGVNSSAEYEYTPNGINTIMREVSDTLTRCISTNSKVSTIEINSASPDIKTV